MKIGAIIQARMGSTRLPGKVMQLLFHKPMLWRVIERTRLAKSLDKVIIATTKNSEDDPIESFCQKHEIDCFRGSETDLLDRYYQAANFGSLDVVVRITSDCPLIEPSLIDDVVTTLLERPGYDYVSNTIAPRTFPRGLDVEAMRFQTLKAAWSADSNPAFREHATPYIYQHPDIFNLYGVRAKQDFSNLRWTVDTSEDFHLVSKIYDHFKDSQFSWLDVIEKLKTHPEWIDINREVQQKTIPVLKGKHY